MAWHALQMTLCKGLLARHMAVMLQIILEQLLEVGIAGAPALSAVALQLSASGSVAISCRYPGLLLRNQVHSWPISQLMLPSCC